MGEAESPIKGDHQAVALDSAPAEVYSRDDVRRIAGVKDPQLRSWQKQGFLTLGESFGFSDLLALKTLKHLRERKVAPQRIQQAIHSLRNKLAGIQQPLAQLRITAEGRRITVHVGGSLMEPISGQLLLDFDAKEIEKLRAFPLRTAAALGVDERLSEHWFQRGLTLEETGAPVTEAVEAYRKAIEINPNASGALVNLGTISFRMRRLKDAADYYARAMKADPEYPLAHFNLGNLYDEQADYAEARVHYKEAIRLNPRYADAYFNLALLCERTGSALEAVGCWQTYLKLDSTSSWAATARKQLDHLKRSLRSK